MSAAAAGAKLRALDIMFDVQAAICWPGPAAARDLALGRTRTRGGGARGALPGGPAGGGGVPRRCDAEEHAGVVWLLWGILGTRTRALGPEDRIALASTSILVHWLLHLGECAEVVVLMRATLAVFILALPGWTTKARK